METFGPGTAEAGTAAMTVAAAYHNAGDFAASEPWYALSLEHRKKVLDPHDRELAISYTKVARCALFRGDHAAAQENFDRAKAIFAYILEHRTCEPEDAYPYYYGLVLMEEARLFMAQGRYEEALAQSRQSYEVLMACYERDKGDLHFPLVDMGKCCSALGQYDEAEEYLRRARALDEELMGPKCLTALETREAMADNTLRRGDRERARQLYSEMEVELEGDFGPDTPTVRRLREKREAAERAD